jgi:hypothetical protein
MSYFVLLPLLITLDIGGTTIRGQYLEARTCDVFAGACFANADTGLTGKNAVLAWKIDTGTMNGTKLDGLGVLAVISTAETLGLKQSVIGRAVVIVDEKATPAQRQSLVQFVQKQAGRLVGEVVAIRSSSINLSICNCDGEGCATLTAGMVKIATRCIDLEHDKACGNESTIYSPLVRGVSAKPAYATEHSFTGTDLNETWSDSGRRGAFVGSFVTR